MIKQLLLTVMLKFMGETQANKLMKILFGSRWEPEKPVEKEEEVLKILSRSGHGWTSTMRINPHMKIKYCRVF